MRRFTLLGLILGALACAAVIGCAAKALKTADVTFSPLVEIQLPAKDVGQVRAWITNKPDVPYEELGILTYKVWTPSPDEMGVVNLFKTRAAELGGDAIIMLDSRTGSAANSYTKITYAYTDFRAMLIRYAH